MKAKICTSLLMLLLALLPGLTTAATISAIKFEGNEKTKEIVLRQELLIHEGDEVDEKKIEDSRQAMMNLGLFKSVTTRMEEETAGIRLIFTVEERYYMLPIPLFNVKVINDNIAEGVESYTYGVQLRLDNLMGLNQRLKIEYETEEPEDDAFENISYSPKEHIGFEYYDPRIIGTEFQFSLKAKHVDETVQEFEDDILTGQYRQKTASGGFNISRLLDEEWFGDGWSAGFGMYTVVTNYQDATGTGLEYEDNTRFEVSSELNLDEVKEHPYHRHGRAYGYKLTVSSTMLGSDYSYTRHLLYYRRYLPLDIPDSNFNHQVQLGLANGDDEEAYSLGNKNLLRGYDNDYVTGNAMFLYNGEYHQQFSTYRQLRGVLFIDVGNAWESPNDIDLGRLYTSLGVGFRWRVQSFVDVTLRADYGYAVKEGTSAVYVSTKASF